MLSVYRDFGVVPKASRLDNFNKTPDNVTRYLHVEPGDLVVNKMKAWSGSVGVSQHEGIVSGDYLVCAVAEDLVAGYLHHLLRSKLMIGEMKSRSLGIRPNQERLYWEDLAEIDIPLPDPSEQRRIADFLDDRVSRIDRIIAARREQMALAATQHISALQELFDDLAGQFGVLRLGHVLRGLEQGWSPQADSQSADPDEWGVMRAGCVNGGYFRPEDNKRLPDNLEPVVAYEIRKGDLLMSRASGSLDLIGSVAVVPADVRRRLLLCDKIYRLFPDSGWTSEFLAPMMRTHSNRELIRLGVSGAEGMANNLPSGVIRDLKIPAATPEVQQQVALEAMSLASQAEGFNTALARSIELLTEYKSSLITAAVTGELDVSTAGSSIPG